MACFDLRTMWFAGQPGTPGIGRGSFIEKRGYDVSRKVPCGQCIGCRVRHQCDWGVRNYLESTLYPVNSFATFTYDDAHLPAWGSLVPRDMDLLFKRLRKAIAPARFRYYMDGEYGTHFKRPHYHVLFFGWCPPDWNVRRCAGSPHAIVSGFLEDHWQLGHVRASSLHAAQCLYVAKHNVDKLGGEPGRLEYQRVDTETGEVFQVVKPYGRMSRRPGIAGEWLAKFSGDVMVPGVDGVYVYDKLKPMPRYFDRYVDVHDRFLAACREDDRIAASMTPECQYDQTPERLVTRELVLRARLDRASEGRKL